MKLSRRGFARVCFSAFPLLAGLPATQAKGESIAVRDYGRVRLVNRDGRPLHSSDLRPNETYVFHYPFHTTPCFLINLGQTPQRQYELETEDGQQYVWRGGVGPGRAVVAYSAICAHMMTYPARKVSFINYYGRPRRFSDLRRRPTQRAQVIFCCSEKSVYDATQGARVLGGPAKQPLAVIDLAYDAIDDQYYAIGTMGGEMFDRFFEEFGYRLALEYGTEDIRRKVTEMVEVVALAEYCDNLIRC